MEERIEVKDVDWARNFLAGIQTGGEFSDPEDAEVSVSDMSVDEARDVLG